MKSSSIGIIEITSNQPISLFSSREPEHDARMKSSFTGIDRRSAGAGFQRSRLTQKLLTQKLDRATDEIVFADVSELHKELIIEVAALMRRLDMRRLDMRRLDGGSTLR